MSGSTLEQLEAANQGLRAECERLAAVIRRLNGEHAPAVVLHELTGQAHNPDCLHCVLPPVIEHFANTHPDRPGPHLVGDVAMVLGELIGSGVFNAEEDQAELLATMLQFAEKHMRESACSLIAKLKGAGR